MIPEREREALMRLTMCAREECSMCKYQGDCNFDFQYELATKNMNILADALNADRKTEPQYDFGEYADRLWKIAYERGKREALEQTEPSCDTCKLKDTTEWCKRQEVCRAYQPKDEPQTHDLRTETHECVKDTHDKTESTICDFCRYYNSNIPCGSTPSACKEADKFAEEFVNGLKDLRIIEADRKTENSSEKPNNSKESE